MSPSTTRFTVAAPLGGLLLLGAMFLLPPAARCQQANSVGQKAQSPKAKPPQVPPANALPSKSASKTTPNPKQSTIPQLPPKTANPKSAISNQQPPIPSTLNPQPPPPLPPLRLALVGPLPALMQQQAAHVDIDASALGISLPAFWRGNARTPPFGLESNPAASGSLQPARFDALRKMSGATLTRLHPFATPGTLILHPDGTPIVRWESIDAALKQAGEAGEDVIFDVQCPAALSSTLSPEGWRAIAEATLRHYRNNPPAPVIRWEAALTGAEAATRYEPFARLARSLYPDTPVGLNLITSNENEPAKNAATGNAGVKKQPVANVADDIGRIAQIYARNKVPLDSLAWRLADTPGEALQQVDRIRRALSAFPTLKNVFLLPTLPTNTVNTVPAGAVPPENLPFAHPVSFVAHILQAVFSSPPNAFVGALLEEPTPTLPNKTGTVGDASTTAGMDAPPNIDAAQEVFALLNRMAGTRLRAQSDDGGISCLASRSQTRAFALLWREPLGNRSPIRPSPPPANNNTLAVVRLHHLSLENSNGLRVTQTDLAQANLQNFRPASNSNAVLASTPALNSLLPRENTGGAETNSPLPPSGVSDVFWSDNAAPMDVEMPILLEPGGVCLLEITPIKVKNPLAISLTTDAANVSGGDPLKVVLTVRNLSARPQMLDVSFASPFRDLPPQGASHFKPGLLPANGGRAFQFTFPSPVLGTNANVTLNARIGDNAAALTVPVQAPLLATLEAPRTDMESGTGRANIRVRLNNRSLMPLTAHLQAGEKTGTNIQVPAGGKPVVAVLAVPPVSREPGLAAVPLRMESGGQVLQTLYPLIGVPVLCPYAAVKPVIDGDLKEWASNVPLGMGRAEQARGKAWGGPGDVSAYAYAQWDEQFFYFACAVTDDVFTPPTNAAALTQGDCVLFALATPLRANSPAASMSYAKFGMAVMRNSVGASAPTLVRLLPDPKAHDRETAVAIKNARFAVRREDTRTFYEAAIPWSELLAGAASPASAISLSILVNDVDGTARGVMEWGSGLYGPVNPLLFPPLRLIKSSPH